MEIAYLIAGKRFQAEAGWHIKEYQRLEKLTEELEYSFPKNAKDLADKNTNNSYINKLFKVNSLLTSFRMMAYFGDFGNESHKFYDLSNNLTQRVDGLINKIYR